MLKKTGKLVNKSTIILNDLNHKLILTQEDSDKDRM